MLHLSVQCFHAFRCLADTCPDTCCAGWEVDLDEGILAKYQSLPGPLGDEIRSRIVTEEGYTFFRMEGGRCPFLNRQNLCRIILEAGESCLSETCREHPRFWEEYGSRQETCLSISCPEAARLLLSQPFRLVAVETDEPAPPEEDQPDPVLLEHLLTLRDTLFEAALEDSPMERRLETIAMLAGNGELPRNLPDIGDFLRQMETMEFTDQRLPSLLSRTLGQLPAPEQVATYYAQYPMEAENLLLYFLYRYVLRAVWDGYVEEKVLFAVYSLKAIFTMAVAQQGDFPELIRESAILYSREAEHSPDNLENLYMFLSGQ